jgi:hypothetical protein
MKHIFVVILLIISILMNCSKPLEPNNKTLFLSKIYRNSVLTHEFIYYENSTLQKQIFYAFDTILSSETYQYDPNRKISRRDNITDVSGPPSHLYEYSYALYRYNSNGLLEESEYYLKVNDIYEKRSYKTYEYDSIGQIIRANLYLPDSTLKSYTDYKYDKKGNIVMVDSTKFEYDSMRNPYKSLILPEITAYYWSENNITKWIFSDSTSVVISYEYNTEGYPIKSIENGIESIYEYIQK